MNKKMDTLMKRFRSFFLVSSAFSSIVLGACSSRIDQRGKLPEPDKLAQLKPGLDTKEDVLRLIGSPSSTDVFGDEVWIYFHKTTETTSFLEPKILDQKVVEISFDKHDIVKEIRQGDGYGYKVQPVKKITPAAGQEQSVLQQVFGNFGRFSKKDKKE